ncbi:HD-GYP domain-containing protein [Paenibacillus sediminis]|uniref:HD-GYP domain-containing protein (C-di-GMP phosphodiesterase class II) n=1 Tax=Paenibacillus sediminis TaxID=664909 RepID=A0ABS4H6X0_9BACL|nr:HD-GYP domain-containing protein [Paenibacillus sediminis]MBP1938278.1 HD-GYP domain-containing protein (c-di-GMP phosphodiesterase class II) [Paenibacillus sediminis]
MAFVSVSEVKPGHKIVNDVHTSFGSLLFPKGKVLLPRDIEILHAFLIHEIEIEDGTNEDIEKTIGLGSSRSSVRLKQPADKSAVTAQKSSLIRLHDEYDKMILLMKSAFQSVIASELSIYELRNQLESLISYIQHYNILTFTPRVINEYDYIYHNAVLSSLTSYKIAGWIGLPQKDWIQVAFAGLLHDIGNTKIDPAILYKPSALTAEEIEEMRRHTTYGYQLLKNVTAINEGVRLAALQHHEKVDGTGYPLNLEGNKIHVFAKIVSVADIFHAMTLKKAYRKAQSPYLVLEQIHSEAFGKLDPSIVQTFISKVTQFYNGTIVRLSNDQIGEIVFSDRSHPTRPMVSINGNIINLVQDRHIYIEEIITK